MSRKLKYARRLFPLQHFRGRRGRRFCFHRVQRLPSGWFDNKMRCAFRALPVRLIFIQMDFLFFLCSAVRQLYWDGFD
jgi:hypothetical protein